MDKQIINLTKYTLNYYKDGRVLFSLPSNGTIILNESIDNETLFLDNGMAVDIENIKYNSSVILPQENDYIVYVVSAIVASIYSNRNDLLTIGKVVKDGDGRNIGVSSFKKVYNGGI